MRRRRRGVDNRPTCWRRSATRIRVASQKTGRRLHLGVYLPVGRQSWSLGFRETDGPGTAAAVVVWVGCGVEEVLGEVVEPAAVASCRDSIPDLLDPAAGDPPTDFGLCPSLSEPPELPQVDHRT